jgi:hypothetical protein
MFKKLADEPTAEVMSGVLGVGTAGGVLTFALFPLVLPILILTIVATLPLVAIGLVVGLLVGVVIVPIKLIAHLRRRGQRPIETSTVLPSGPSGDSITSRPRRSARIASGRASSMVTAWDEPGR